MSRPLGGGIKRWCCLTSVCLADVCRVHHKYPWRPQLLEARRAGRHRRKAYMGWSWAAAYRGGGISRSLLWDELKFTTYRGFWVWQGDFVPQCQITGGLLSGRALSGGLCPGAYVRFPLRINCMSSAIAISGNRYTCDWHEPANTNCIRAVASTEASSPIY